MIQFRLFRNTDVPRLAGLWRSLGTGRGHVQPMSSDWLEQYVFAKPWFDRAGLILAADGNEVVGFAHASFGPTPDRSKLDRTVGVISMIAAREQDRVGELVGELLSRSEAYLCTRGAQVLHAGTTDGRGPFYLGLYGGSELPGVLESDTLLVDSYSERGFEQVGNTVLMECDLASLRPVVNRSQLQLRRQATVELVCDPPPENWWQACTLGSFPLMRYIAVRNDDRREVARVTVWNLDPLSASRNRCIVGMVDLLVHETERRHGWATFLTCESLKRLQQQGVADVMVQVPATNVAALGLYAKLGFRTVGRGCLLRKAVAAEASSRPAAHHDAANQTLERAGVRAS